MTTTQQTPEDDALQRDIMAAGIMGILAFPRGPEMDEPIAREIANYLALVAAIGRRGAVLTPRATR